MKSTTNKTTAKSLIPAEIIEHSILLIRGQKVLLDRDLANMYEVETRTLVQAVKRNFDRFPKDFMFQLTKEELENWMSQFVISNPSNKMGLRKRPYAFTEQGIAMLSSVLRSERAVAVNIEIIRTFVRLRQILASHEQLAKKLETLEKKYNKRFKIIFDVIRQMMIPPEPKHKPIGFENRSRKS